MPDLKVPKTKNTTKASQQTTKTKFKKYSFESSVGQYLPQGNLTFTMIIQLIWSYLNDMQAFS